MATPLSSSLQQPISGGGGGDVGRRASSYHTASLSPESRQGTFSPSTPDYKRRSLNIPGSDSALASSPILNTAHLSPPDRNSSSLLAPNGGAHAGGSARNSHVSSSGSLRFSRDLDEIKWELASQKDDDDAANDQPKGRPRGVSESDGEGSQNGDLTYSALSKRADFILANAKRKLNLLEGNLGRARHSLIVSPTTIADLNRSDSTASASSAPSPTQPSPRASTDERPSVRGPKINFGTPRQSFNRFQGGHSRVYSDSTVPSPQGNTTVGSRSYEFRRAPDFGKRHPLHKSTPDQALDSVPENPPSPGKRNGRSAPRSGTTSREYTPIADSETQSLAGSRASTSQSADDSSYKTQAEKLRNRISNIQQREASRQRSSPMALVEEDEEEGEGKDIPGRGDSRLEWRQVLESGKTGPGSAGSYLEEDEFDFDEDEEDEDDYVEEEEEEEHDFPADNPEVLRGAHEDRSDAFDYEHFILHSIMGNHPEPEDFVSDGEESTASTERGLEDDGDDEDSQGEGKWVKDNASQTSFHTAQSDENAQSGSEAGDAGVSMGSWPVPPTGRNKGIKHGRKTSKSKEVRRPESEIVSHVLAEANGAAAVPDAGVKNEDRELFYAVATSFREVCLRLQTEDLGQHDQVDLRQRLEIARRVLNGDL